MQLTINGEIRDVADNLHISALLDSLELASARVVVELNHDIVMPADYSTTLLQNGDSLELVQFVGGG